MNRTRKLAMVVGTVAVAMGLGHVLQHGLPGGAERQADLKPAPQDITPLAAGLGQVPDTALPPPVPQSPALTPEAMLPDPAAQNDEDGTAKAETADGLPTGTGADQISGTTEATVPGADSDGVQADRATMGEGAPLPDPVRATLSGDSVNCPTELQLLPAEGATLSLALLAPCRSQERVVIQHGGLTFTGKTSLSGAFSVTFPAMEQTGAVTMRFADGTELQAVADLPDLPIYQRFAVQWMAQDNFGIHAFENRAGQAEPEHVSAANPGRRLPGVPGRGGVLALLGDDSVDLPMLAEVYTWPTDPAVTVTLQIEALVTEAGCAREMLGELLLSQGGAVEVTELSMAMPDCDGVGDVLVLNNPVADMKLALID